MMCVNGLQEDGALGGIRTHDPCLRRAVLYPAELRVLAAAMIRICSAFVHALAHSCPLITAYLSLAVHTEQAAGPIVEPQPTLKPLASHLFIHARKTPKASPPNNSLAYSPLSLIMRARFLSASDFYRITTGKHNDQCTTTRRAATPNLANCQ